MACRCINRHLPPAMRFQRIVPSCILISLGWFLIGPFVRQLSPNGTDTNTNQPSASILRSSDVDSQNSPFKRDGNIKILMWTDDGIINWPVGSEGFEMCKLPEGESCEIYFDRKYYNSSEVVMFHGQKIDVKDMPGHRFREHRWMFYEIETPPQTWIQQESLEAIKHVFNLTSTITVDSNIPILERHRTCYIDEDRYQKIKSENVNFAQGKGHKIAWFVSHCETQSRREDYAKELAKYIPIDIWGKCGNNSCGNKYQRGDCDKMILNEQFKFYLSFENSICESYVTEKLWRLIMQPITSIPIVLGGVDYKNILPAGTYLDIRDFASPEDLAKRLKELDENDKEFNEMIAKKNAVMCKHPGNKWYHQIRYQCELCNYLHEHRMDVTEVKDVLDFWSEDRRCTKAEDYYKGSLKL